MVMNRLETDLLGERALPKDSLTGIHILRGGVRPIFQAASGCGSFGR
jgi:aspartate ammonia-lyase